MNTTDLDPSQRRALAQLQDLTNSAEDDVAINVLDTVNWDVQRAAELIFGTAAAPQATPRIIQTFDIDDSHQGEHRPRPRVSTAPPPTRPPTQPAPPSSLYAITRPLLSLLTFPLHILSNIFRFVFGILRIPIPQLRFSTLSFYRTLPRGPRPSYRGGPDRWIRELEEETGAICISRSKAPQGISSSTGTDNAGPSSLTSRPRALDDGRKILPDFTLGTYEEVLRTCQREARIGCIILVSEEHDDVTEFKRSTLTDSTFVKMLHDNNIIVWGGDVRDQEAWSAAEKLQATTYPFVAFIALQPRRSPITSSRSTSSASAAPPSLTVLSRHQGPCIPTSSAPTSASTLTQHLTHQLLPRVTPFLERIHAAERDRDRDRQLREDQDRAFRDSARRDKERIEGKMREERMERARQLAAEEEERGRARRLDALREKEAARMEWRRWARGVGVGVQGERGLRIAIRLPSGVRVIREFASAATLTSLYVFVDTQLIPAQLSPDHDPQCPPDGGSVVGGGMEAAMEEQAAKAEGGPRAWWGFQLVLAYPRKEVPWVKGVRLADVENLKGGGQVVVELLDTGRLRSAIGNGEDGNDDGEDDGYSTEE